MNTSHHTRQSRPPRLMALSEVLEVRAQPQRRAAPVAFTPVDFSRPFIPEHFTQLYHTPQYAGLNDRQRLRYNQLFGIKVNEQFMMFESDFTNQILKRLLTHPAVRSNPELAVCMQGMIREEEVHYEMFRALNQRCLPQVYHRGDRYFTRLPAHERLALRAATAFPRQLVFLLWFLISMEEYSIALSRAMVDHRCTDSLGELEPNVVRVHREHVKDESRHVHIDVHLIRACVGRLTHTARRVNAWLLRRFMRDIVVPKRGGMAVLYHFLDEHPELAPRRKALIASVRALGEDARFQRTLFNREMMPRTFALLDEVPELAPVGHAIAGWSNEP